MLYKEVSYRSNCILMYIIRVKIPTDSGHAKKIQGTPIWHLPKPKVTVIIAMFHSRYILVSFSDYMRIKKLIRRNLYINIDTWEHVTNVVWLYWTLRKRDDIDICACTLDVFVVRQIDCLKSDLFRLEGARLRTQEEFSAI